MYEFLSRNGLEQSGILTQPGARDREIKAVRVVQFANAT
jgi:hypothetical protein